MSLGFAQSGPSAWAPTALHPQRHCVLSLLGRFPQFIHFFENVCWLLQRACKSLSSGNPDRWVFSLHTVSMLVFLHSVYRKARSRDNAWLESRRYHQRGNDVCVGLATNGFWNHTILDCRKCSRLIETRHMLTAAYFWSCSSCWPRTQRGWDDITTFMPHLPLPYVCFYFPLVRGCCPNARKHTFHTLLDGTKEFREPKQKSDCHIVLNKNIVELMPEIQEWREWLCVFCCWTVKIFSLGGILWVLPPRHIWK